MSAIFHAHQVRTDAEMPPDTLFTEAFGHLAFNKIGLALVDNQISLQQQALTLLCAKLQQPQHVIRALATDILHDIATLLSNTNASSINTNAPTNAPNTTATTNQEQHDDIDSTVSTVNQETQQIKALVSQALELIAKNPMGRKRILDSAFLVDIIKLVTDENKLVRVHSYQCLRYLSDLPEGLNQIDVPAHIEIFVNCSRTDAELDVRVSALYLLNRCLRRASGLNAALHAGGMDALKSLLSHDSAMVRAHAAQCICTLSEHEQGRAAAIKAQTLPTLTSLLHDIDVNTKAHATGALMYLCQAAFQKAEVLQTPTSFANIIQNLDDHHEGLLLNTLMLIGSLSEHPEGRKAFSSPESLQRLNYFIVVGSHKKLLQTTAEKTLKIINWTP